MAASEQDMRTILATGGEELAEKLASALALLSNTDQGSGTLTLSGANTYKGPTQINVNAGVFQCAPHFNGQAVVHVAAGATVALANGAVFPGPLDTTLEDLRTAEKAAAKPAK